jgi:putative addiction module killer protein
LPGDFSAVDEGVFELRIHVGPGYRLYYANEGNRIVILLCGRTKKRQQSDIDTAGKLLKELKGDERR